MNLLDYITKKIGKDNSSVSGFRSSKNKWRRPKIGYKERRIRSRIKTMNKRK